jgi:formylmethanofuran--tetrahydromethanopterin N-formyltransferase
MHIGPTLILDTYAEAFGARFTRLIITAANEYWRNTALSSFTGYGTSVIGCDAEVGIEQMLAKGDSPDGRPAAAVLLFGFSAETLAKAVQHRVAQCVLTCPTTACFSGLPERGRDSFSTGDSAVDPKKPIAKESRPGETYSLGKYLRYFGDGFESQESRAKNQEPGVSGSRLSTLDSGLFWRIPVMDGEFIIEETGGVAKGVAGGNIILQAASQAIGLAAAQRAAGAIAARAGVITPFPGGVCRSGSKVGSKYKGLVASTAEAYCPTLRDRVESRLVDGAQCAYEIVIDGVDKEAVASAMQAAIEAAAASGVLAIDAGNYGGKLGKYPIRLHELFS